MGLTLKQRCGRKGLTMIIYLYVLIGCVILFINIFNALLVWTNNKNNTLCEIAENSAFIFLIMTAIILLCLK